MGEDSSIIGCNGGSLTMGTDETFSYDIFGVIAAVLVIATLVLAIRTVFLTWRKRYGENLYIAGHRGLSLLFAGRHVRPLFTMA